MKIMTKSSITEHKSIPDTDKKGKKVKKLWKEKAACERCGRIYIVNHKLRKYCDECKNLIRKRK